MSSDARASDLMRSFGAMKRLAAMMVVAGLVLAVAVPSQAREGDRNGHHGRFAQQRTFEGRRSFDGHRAAHHWGGPRVFIGVGPSFGWGAYPYATPVYTPAPPPTYWYYCPSYGAYYPNVANCPEQWVPVPAAP
jgi:hypothetical protein